MKTVVLLLAVALLAGCANAPRRPRWVLRPIPASTLERIAADLEEMRAAERETIFPAK